VLLLRKGGTHFEEATRVNDGGGFPYDRHGHGREPVKSPESQDYGDSSRRQVKDKIGRQNQCQAGCESGAQDVFQAEDQAENVPGCLSAQRQETGAEAHLETETDTKTETDKKTLTNPSLFNTLGAAQAAPFFKNRSLSGETAPG
jgi:hypothetical protein